MPRPDYIELLPGERINVLYEDRSVMALDKPRGWMLVPYNWQRTDRNLHAAIDSAIAAGEFWARSRGLRFLRHVHRLDADTTGVLLCARSPGALESFTRLFETHRMEKTYLAVVQGLPKQAEWICRLNLAPDPKRIGRMLVDARTGKESESHFRVLESRGDRTLIEARPRTGRTHQLRVHLAESGFPIIGDKLYGRPGDKALMALRAISLAYRDPFTGKRVQITAPTDWFLRESGFGGTPKKRTDSGSDALRSVVPPRPTRAEHGRKPEKR